jgi:hypothetical protein
MTSFIRSNMMEVRNNCCMLHIIPESWRVVWNTLILRENNRYSCGPRRDTIKDERAGASPSGQHLRTSVFVNTDEILRECSA